MINNSTIINFGNGDIEILVGRSKHIGKIGFNSLQSPEQIGKVETGNFEENFFRCPVVMTFTKTESIDSLIQMLEEVKKKMKQKA